MKNAQSCIDLLQESEEKFQKIAENSLVGMFIHGEYFLYVNRAFVKMTGYKEEELLCMHLWDLFEGEDRETFMEIVKRRAKGEMFASVLNESFLVKKNKERVSVKVSTETIHYRGEYAGIGIMIDISDVVKKNQVIKVLVQALSQSDDIIFITNRKGIIEYTNKALTKKYGYRAEEVLGKSPALFSSNLHNKEFYTRLWNAVLKGKNYHETIVNKKKNGELIYVDTKITPVRDEAGKDISHFVVTARDITKRMLIEKKLKELATIDPLTQIPNRYQLNLYFDEFIARAKRRNTVFSVLMFDIDYFKKINDRYGHHMGDNVLKAFSQLIVENIRVIDKFGRWGGEEFILLLDGADEDVAMEIGKKLNMLVANMKFDMFCSITVSIGVTKYRDKEKKEECIKRADKALYIAKNLGRNRVVLL